MGVRQGENHVDARCGKVLIDKRDLLIDMFEELHTRVTSGGQ